MTAEEIAVCHAEVVAEFALHGQTEHWSLYEEWLHLERFRKRQQMDAERHGASVPAAQPPCEECKVTIPPPSGRKTVRYKARRFCSKKCAMKANYRSKK